MKIQYVINRLKYIQPYYGSTHNYENKYNYEKITETIHYKPILWVSTWWRRYFVARKKKEKLKLYMYEYYQ